MKLSRLPALLGGALAMSLLGVAPLHADPGLPPASIWAAGAGWCTDEAYTDCGTLHLKVGLWKEQTPPGTTVLLQLRGCDGDEDVRMAVPDSEAIPKVGTPYTVNDLVATDDGTRYEVPYFFWTSYPGESFHLGPAWTGTLTVTRPGFEPWVQQISHATPSGDATLGRYTDALVCPRDDADVTTYVDNWSRVKGKPVVGRRLRASRTTFTPLGQELGAKARYAWLVGGKVVGRRLSLRVKRAYRGKMLAFSITLDVPGKGKRSEAMVLGRVRVRR